MLALHHIGVMPNTFYYFDVMFMYMLFWNCRGVKNIHFSDSLQDMCKNHKMDAIFIAKPKISGDQADDTISKLKL